MQTEQRRRGWIEERSQHFYAIIFWLLSLLLFWKQLTSLARLAFHDELASHILLIPLISAFLIYLERDQIFRTARYCPSFGVPGLLMVLLLWNSPLSSLRQVDHLSVVAIMIVLVWISGFVLFYGIASFEAAVFPLLFLFLMSPLPGVVTGHIVSILQRGSAATCYALFRILGIPVVRHAFQFSLPGVDIEVAEQCSGIHAGLSLFIAGLLAAHLLLRDVWKKVCFTLCIIPIAIFKNAVRIVTIAWLGIHVNPAFFHGTLHRQGGLPFSLLALAMLAILLWLLRLPVGSSRTHDPDGSPA